MATIKKNTAPAETPRETWNTIKGQMKLFVKCFSDGHTAVSTSIGRKDGDEWFNFYLPVYLSKECKIELIEGLNTINIKNSFLSPFKRKDGNASIQLVITEAENI